MSRPTITDNFLILTALSCAVVLILFRETEGTQALAASLLTFATTAYKRDSSS